MEISLSIFGLAKNNNGFFKSEKQAKFLTSKIEEYEGCIGQANSGYNSCPIFATYDSKGIIDIVKSTKSGNKIMFQRKIQGEFTVLEVKRLKSLKRQLNALNKEIKERQENWDSGNYNGSGDICSYTEDMINRFNHFQQTKIEQLEFIKNQIKEINK